MRRKTSKSWSECSREQEAPASLFLSPKRICLDQLSLLRQTCLRVHSCSWRSWLLTRFWSAAALLLLRHHHQRDGDGGMMEETEQHTAASPPNILQTCILLQRTWTSFSFLVFKIPLMQKVLQCLKSKCNLCCKHPLLGHFTFCPGKGDLKELTGIIKTSYISPFSLNLHQSECVSQECLRIIDFTVKPG